MFAQVLEHYGRVDILVNDAGIIRQAMPHKMSGEEWDAVIEVHRRGSFNCLQAVTPGMMARAWGRIINVTSAAGLLGTIGQVNYGAAKAGIVGLTLSAARERARYGITVRAVAPGPGTPMTETTRTDERFRQSDLDRMPIGRWAEPEEIAPAFVFFASAGCNCVTGPVRAADGGMTIG
jgi:3-oxoacyl-[acyl-carrier protein] reductase